MTRALLVLTFAVLPAAAADPPKAAKRPNVLYIAADDLNTRLGCYGDALAKTPHLDKLAAGGVRFDRAYCQYPLCNPSRSSILSGRRPDTTKVFNNGTLARAHVGKDAVFLPELFRANGYFTARVGKIAHHAHEDQVTWDVSEHPRGPNGVNLMEKAYAAVEGTGIGEFTLGWKATQTRDEDEPDGVVATRVIELLRQAKKDGKPFFLAAGFYRPHLPFVAPKKYFDLYALDKIRLPAEPAGHLTEVPKPALVYNPNDARYSEDQKREAILAYLASVSFMDAQVGRLLAALEELKLTDDTIVVFFGDHGFHLGEHGGLFRKQSLFEESARVPLIVRVPGRATGVSPRLVELVDLYPTLADLAGLTPPVGLEGTSFKPLLGDPKRAWKSAAFTTVTRPPAVRGGEPTFGRSVRTERYRYTEWDGHGAELYDHDSDPKEFFNLADDPKHAGTVKELKKRLTDGWKAAVPTSPPAESKRPEGGQPVSVMTDVYPFLKKHCVSCHNDAAPRAERTLTGYQDAASILNDRSVWDDVLRHVEAKSMPPAAERQPLATETAVFVRNVRQLREQADMR
ncbi:sulfatase [Fimbriiglobus ruber]|uniref:Choline-sulfatase n=1 Tax=Fimbriiglobus ruber TaxID=1908690 RepID=A0A225DFC5_9BACT|nr:sulfatase [Fimbriiglobus ruber]OWK40182.1 Choline-sulfatase [Fimbriiglobus ruber]